MDLVSKREVVVVCGRRVLFLVAVIGCSAFLSQVASAQDPGDYDASGFAFQRIDDGPPIGSSVEPPELHVEHVDPRLYLDELHARGVVLPEPRSLATGPRPLSPDAAREAISQSVVEYARSLQGDELLDVIVELSELPFAEIRELKRMDPQTRQQVLADREYLVRGAQADFATHAQEYGAEILQSLWIANQLRLLVPASAMEDVLGILMCVRFTLVGDADSRTTTVLRSASRRSCSAFSMTATTANLAAG